VSYGNCNRGLASRNSRRVFVSNENFSSLKLFAFETGQQEMEYNRVPYSRSYSMIGLHTAQIEA
jgi:hypothetical protein